ncbi:MAG: transcriptional regulator [Saccharospirillaceae bacterium]|nr:transcriptional regulator [Pseudomonadales bacterium]NRB80397.1 transcriptional regulator [Saccharospirillaceae bacterium]
MNISNLLNVNPVLVDRVRLSIMATLAFKKEPVDFNSIIIELGLTKGNLSTHMKKLETEKFVEITKEFVGRKPKTTYSCTKFGKEALNNYLKTVEDILKKTSG